MSIYVASSRDRPGRIAFWSQALAEVASAVACQPDPDKYDVRRHHAGAALYFDDDEQAELRDLSAIASSERT
jgi:hypothetical protein